MKFLKYTLLVLLILCFIGGVASAKDSLIVYGENFAIHVAEPPGWEGVTDDANRYRVNLYFRMPGYDFNNSPALMYVRVLPKNGMAVSRHLEIDMHAFFQKKSVVFEPFDVPGISYGYAAKKYLFPDNHIDYLCYIDPSEKVDYYIIFVLTGPQEIAEKTLDVFVSLVQSFLWVGVLNVIR